MTEKKEEEKKKGESKGADNEGSTSTEKEKERLEGGKEQEKKEVGISERLANIERNFAKAFERSTASGRGAKSLDFTTLGLNAKVYTLNEIQGYAESELLEV